MVVNNDHLITGTVLDIGGDVWACITSACDLVPGQKVTQWQSRIGDLTWFLKRLSLSM